MDRFHTEESEEIVLGVFCQQGYISPRTSSHNDEAGIAFTQVEQKAEDSTNHLLSLKVQLVQNLVGSNLQTRLQISQSFES